MLPIGVILLCLLAPAANAANTLKELGRHPFITPPLTSIEDLKTMVSNHQQDLQQGFIAAGQPDLYKAFIEQFPSAHIETLEYGPGEQFQWMLYKRNGKGTVRVARDITWGGEKPFTGFQLTVEKGATRHTIVIPLICGNLALKDSSDIPPVAVVTPPNQSPECKAAITPTRTFCGEPVLIDGNGSSDKDGTIAAMHISVIDKEGNVVSEQAVEEQPLTHEMAMPCGNNTVRVTVTDNQGAEATSASCESELVGTKRTLPVADVGYFRQFDPGDYLFGRVGLEHRFTEQFSILGMVGGSLHVKGSDGDSALLLDVLGNYSWEKFFVSFGLGGWISSGDNDLDAEDSGLDLICDIGTRIYGEEDGFNASLFLEVRSATDELDNMVKYGRYGLGLRMRF